MSHIHIERDHGLGIEQARDRIEAVAAELQEEIGLAWRWEDDLLILERAGASGSVSVEADRIVLDIRLGLLLTALKGKIEHSIEERIDGHLA